jgi:hypothetical protein
MSLVFEISEKMAIPMNLATQSEGIWPGVPIERGHLIRSMLAPPRSEATLGFSDID